jgi:hypothetical protein
MKIKKTLKTAVAAVAMAAAAAGASADTLTPVQVNGNSFTDLVIGTINIASLSNLSGSLFAADSVNFTFGNNTFTLMLDSVTFTNGTVGALVDNDPTAAGFSFSNVALGSYIVKASGNLTPNGQINGTAFIGANYTVTPVPEPESYALLLAGLGLMGTVARRRARSA